MKIDKFAFKYFTILFCCFGLGFLCAKTDTTTALFIIPVILGYFADAIIVCLETRNKDLKSKKGKRDGKDRDGKV